MTKPYYMENNDRRPRRPPRSFKTESVITTIPRPVSKDEYKTGRGAKKKPVDKPTYAEKKPDSRARASENKTGRGAQNKPVEKRAPTQKKPYTRANENRGGRGAKKKPVEKFVSAENELDALTIEIKEIKKESEKQAPNKNRRRPAAKKPDAAKPAYTAKHAYDPARETAEPGGEDSLTMLEGRNAVMEALKSGKPIDSLLVKKGDMHGTLRVITAMAKEKDVVIKEMTKEKLDSISETGKHQGVIAYVAAHEYAEIEDMLKAASRRGTPPFIILLDGITDPRNLGAIIRTAEAAGADGVIIPKRRGVGLTPATGKASAGAVAYVPVARAVNITNAIAELKKAGLWVACADLNGDDIYEAADSVFTEPFALVIGGEGGGVSRLVREKCDFTLSVPMRGKINSLNASVAAAVVIYETLRRRLGGA